MAKKLYPYQKTGVRQIEKFKGRALLADDMGLGKSIISLVYLYRNPKAMPTLIICPSSLKINWRREARKWLGTRVEVLRGREPYGLRMNPVTIINYDIVHHWEKYLSTIPFRCLILDEAHYIKSSGAKRTNSVIRISKRIRRVIAITGTPIENRPIEIFNILNVIKPKLFPEVYPFAHKYCDAKRRYGRWDFTGISNSKKLHLLLKKHMMIRRLKKDVLKELPPKVIVNIPIRIDNRKVYREAEHFFIEYVSDTFDREIEQKVKVEMGNFMAKYNVDAYELGTHVLKQEDIQEAKFAKLDAVERAPALTQIEILKKLSVQGKMKAIFEWIDMFLEGTDEKLAVFATHRFVIEDLYAKYNKISVKMYGGMTDKQRQNAVDSFQTNKKTRLFFGNIKSAGVGITLTAASNAAVVQFPWSPSELDQVYDRIHRITQTKQVTIYNLVGLNTIEEDIVKLLKQKKAIIEEVIDGKTPKDTSNTMLSDLIKLYKNKK